MGIVEENTVAVISHPGYHSHRQDLNLSYKRLCLDEKETRNIIEGNPLFFGEIGQGTGRAMQLAAGIIGTPLHMAARQIIYELELFESLRQADMVTVLTVPMVNGLENRELVLNEDRSLPILSAPDNGFKLSPVMSESFPKHLEEQVSGMKTVYILPTEHEMSTDGRLKANGLLYDHVAYAQLMQLCQGKKVIFTGSNLFECAESTLLYLANIDCNIEILLNYCGISGKRGSEFVTSIEKGLKKATLIDMVREHKYEPNIVKQLVGLFPKIIRNVNACFNEIGQASVENKIKYYDGYIKELL